jgi:hypothetical protein
LTLIKSKVIKQKTKKCRIYKENGQCVEGSNPSLAIWKKSRKLVKSRVLGFLYVASCRGNQKSNKTYVRLKIVFIL